MLFFKRPSTTRQVKLEQSSKSHSDAMSSLRENFGFIGDSFHEFIELIEQLAVTTPNVSQALSRTVLLGNTGHSVTFEGLSKSQESRAHKEINYMAQNVFRLSAGIDGFVNKLIRQIAITGALSAEWVPNMPLSGIEKVVTVPTRQIRFKERDGEYIPLQQVGIEEVELNINQYMYIPTQTQEGSPYAIPPYLSALYSIFIEKDSMENIKHMLKKFGLLGFVSATKKSPLLSFGRAGKTEDEHKNELHTELENFAKNFENNFSKGVAISYDDVSYDYKSFGASSARGAKDIFQEVEQQIASGLDIDPALLGRTYSTTETYAGVVYSAFLSQLDNIRRTIKRFLERGYKMHLTLAGLDPSSLKVTFNGNRGLRPKEDAEAKEVKTRVVLMKVEAGIIDLDTAARELGYEKATGKANMIGKPIKAMLDFPNDGEYPRRKASGSGFSEAMLDFPNDGEYPRRKASGSGFSEAMLDFPNGNLVKKKVLNEPPMNKKRKEVLKGRMLEREAIQEFLVQYGDEVVALTNVIKKMVKDKRANREIQELISKKLKTNIPDNLLPTILESVKRVWQAGSEIETEAGTIVGGHADDQDAIDFFTKQQRFDFGKVVGGLDAPLKEAVLDSLKGIGKTEKEIFDLLDNAVPEIMKDRHAINHYRLVISNAVNKSRNFARTLTFEEIGIQTLEIVAIVDLKTSEICRTMSGRRMTTKTASTYVKDVMATDPDQVVKNFPWPKKVPQGVSTKKILSGLSVKLPPYHGRCRTTTVVGLPETIVTQTGKAIKEPKWPDQKEIRKISSDQKRKIERDRLAKTRKFYKGLTNEEIASKINSARGSQWIDTKLKNKKDNQFLGHFAKHKDGFKAYGKNVLVKTQADYINVSRRVLNDFDRVFPHAHAMGKLASGADRVGFYNSKLNVVTIVDMNEHRITSSFAMDRSPDDYFKYAMELK